MVCPGNTVIEVPIVLRDRLAAWRIHPRQAYFEVIEEALDVWEDLVRHERRPSP
jgi:hypothetical protein